MYRIYCIKNLINNKMYVGKTRYDDINKRLKEHINDSKKDRCKNRPLYRAFNKYGVENFQIELLEIVGDEFSNEREIFWINKLCTFGRKGYNATKGGDGKSYVDEELIINEYIDKGLIKEVALITGYHEAPISEVLNRNRIKKKNNKEWLRKANGKEVYMCDKEGNILKHFDSISSASEYIIIFLEGTDFENTRKRIGQCCLGNLNSYKGTYWKYV